MAEIEFDFCMAGQALHEIKNITNEMNTEVLADFEDAMQELSRYWNGDAGRCFQELAKKETVQMKQTIQDLKYTDSCMREAILKAERIEEKAKETAKLRKY